MNKMIVLDLDGVITDFVQPALKLHGKNLEPHLVRWDFMGQIGMSQNDFWSPLGHDFWATLPFTKEAYAFLSGLEGLLSSANIVLCTSPCATHGGVEGKVEWIKKHLPKYARQFFVGPPKHFLAGPGKLLVDDYNENILAFQRAGGATIMVPRPWNDRRGECVGDGSEFSVDEILNEVKIWRDFA